MVAGRVWGTSPRSSTLFVADIFCHILTSCQTKMQRQICRRRVIAKCSRYRVHMIHRSSRMIILARRHVTRRPNCSSFVLDISRRISLIGNADPTWVPECLLGHDLWLWLWPDGSSMLMENPSYPSINGRRLGVAGSSRKPPQCLCVYLLLHGFESFLMGYWNHPPLHFEVGHRYKKQILFKEETFLPLQKGLDLPTNLPREVTNGNQGGLDTKMRFFL